MADPITKSTRKRILFIVNPISGTRGKESILHIINNTIDNETFEPEILFTRKKGDALQIISEKIAEGFKYFVAVGGDGTVNEVGSAIINTDCVMGIIPLGSGNGLARHLRIPLDAAKAIQVINKLRVESIDYGLVNGLPFFCTCGVGFDAHIGYRFAKEKGRGFFNYVKVALTDFIRYKPKKYKVKIDGTQKMKVKAFLITCANASQYGNNAYIAPNADIQDGLLDIAIMSPINLLQAPAIGAMLFTRTINKSTVLQTGKAQKIVIKRKREDVVHFDGEPIIMDRKIRITVVNKGLRIIVP
ncbi:MAG: YegS/Rv2252/BmrU family lipid kinase [Tenuifilum sp.]|uniref:diacylglycerol/lipid kinase family protein n=1 Tax=Tenuifilum sp. TaxID=2760880 RepID=UPI001B48BD63|nr:YegS/Rv2252/BmrU family lipid kinase [Bacteroidales bacterium]HOK60969.1 YegS/Rv2252/BmrU family lipid kinase [Tenuifilum sp.]HOK85426.1 YegS/Rv2252/BmrU family lipid kinase [Tenuifilum sp.]HON70236.1 YegS/Rv2252/BmrU family lipid kinase [Tenuifilum sp.]HPP89145.1 YegS/Rv2252/BmrU family lipid kinase [Tenuifilum sp.]